MAHQIGKLSAVAVSKKKKPGLYGDITPDEASGVAALVEVYRKTLETSELEGRLQALEQAKG